MLDAERLADAFEGNFNENQPDSILTKYSEIRRDIFKKYTDPWSQGDCSLWIPRQRSVALLCKRSKNASASEETRQAFINGPQVLRVDIRDYFLKV